MIEFDIKKEWFDAAKIKAEELGHLKHSIEGGAGNLTGFIGEHLVQNVFEGSEFSNTYDYDLVLRNGITIDVKTKRTTVTPRPNYACTISDYYLQKCDYYAFVRILNDYSKGWFLGFKSHDDFLREATRVKKGDVCESNGFVSKLDGYDLEIGKLDTDYGKLNN